MFDLRKEQERLEQYMQEEAQGRLDKENKSYASRGEWSDSTIGTRFVKQMLNIGEPGGLDPLSAAITSFITKDKTKPGAHNTAAKLLVKTGLRPDTIAYLTTKAVFNCVGKKYNNQRTIKKTTVATTIGDKVHDEWRVSLFKDNEFRSKLLDKLTKDFNKRSYPREWRKRTIKNYFESEQISWQGWSHKEKTQIGLALLHLFVTCTGVVDYSDCGSFIELSDKLEDSLLKSSQMVEWFVLYKPMVVPPVKWSHTNLFKGGYHYSKSYRYPLIKRTRRRDADRIMSLDLSRVFPAINALQETPWRVNRQMLEALQWAYNDFRKGIGSVPLSDPKPLPPIPAAYEADPEVKKKHNREVFELRDYNRRIKSQRIFLLMTMQLGEMYKGYDAIYFPHNLDSRGRAYPITAFLSPQGPDYVKALLEFSAGHPVDEEGKRWICIAGANAWGNDKVSLSDRVAWVESNRDQHLSIAADCRADLRWTHASEPWQYLRFCFEYAGMQQDGWLSRMVVPVDATCSGLQHYSAMLRDEIGGRSVNLVPGLSRQDVYGDVAKVTEQKLREDGSQDALDWLEFGINRKMTKRQVMVVPYAGKFSSCLGYTREAVSDRLADGELLPWDHRDEKVHGPRIGLLAKYIWEAISEVVVKSREAMQWLSKVASNYAKQANARTDLQDYDKRMSWFTPDGFEVIHYREAMKPYRVETILDGRLRTLTYTGEGRLDPKDMALAVAPNFVHALDATHLRMTINKALQLGITDFAMVHDSFGVHAGKMPTFLQHCVKPAFVELYQTDVLQEFADRFKDCCDIPPIPSKGKLDLDGVLRSEFFFS